VLYYSRALKKNLQKDKKHFPPPLSGATKLPSFARVPQWQADVSQAMLAMAGYQIDSAQDDDEGVELEYVPLGDDHPRFLSGPNGVGGSDPAEEEQDQDDLSAGGVPDRGGSRETEESVWSTPVGQAQDVEQSGLAGSTASEMDIDAQAAIGPQPGHIIRTSSIL
jgi:hypothetical protein